MEDFEYKQVLVVRGDLKMGRGKIAAQIAHAAVTSSEIARKNHFDSWSRWIKEGQKKVVVKVSGLSELLKLAKMAEQKRLPFAVIRDRGLTEIPPGTITSLGIGPARNEYIDPITGDLPLL